MGFGQVGRQVYRLALDDDRYEVVAVSDIGRPEILHHLLTKSMGSRLPVRLESNYLVRHDGDAGDGAVYRTRLLPADKPAEIPWDVFGADLVVDTTARFRSADSLAPHLDNGARRVILSTLPEGEIDRVVLYGVNQKSIDAGDRIVSAGSASTTATALALKVLAGAGAIQHATMTSVHAYTSDQILQDYAGPDYRRSRSGAENIIPNDTPAPRWVERAAARRCKGKVSGFRAERAGAGGLPAGHDGGLCRCPAVEADRPSTTGFLEAAAAAEPALIAATRDPIVSSDVKGRSAIPAGRSPRARMKAGSKTSSRCWLGMSRSAMPGASLDLAALYGGS